MLRILIILNISILTFRISANCQPVSNTEAEAGEVLTIQPQWEIKFKNEDQRRSFKMLREFLKEKEAELDLLKKKLSKLESDEFGDETKPDTSINPKIRQDIKELNQLIEMKPKPTDSVKVAPRLLVAPELYRLIRYSDTHVYATIAQINAAIDEKKNFLEKNIADFRKYNSEKKILESNIKNVTSDITKCTQQIDSALAPEYQQQDFRKIISVCFSILIGLLVSIFFLIVYKRSDNSLSKDLLSGNGLQFITLFVLIIAVILFGILNILGSSELAAILSGISGYILGKGTQKDLTNIISSTMPPITNPNYSPTQKDNTQ